MQIKSVPVTVEWQGNKINELPEGKQYSTIAKFHDDIDWPNDAWSIVLDFSISPKQQGNPTMGRMRFLVDNAPHERLMTGKKVELYEGMQLTAKVTIE